MFGKHHKSHLYYPPHTHATTVTRKPEHARPISLELLSHNKA